MTRSGRAVAVLAILTCACSGDDVAEPRSSPGASTATSAVASTADSVQPATNPPVASEAAPAPAQPAVGFPAQPGGVPYPTERWTTGDWPAEVERRPVEDAVEAAFARGGPLRVRAVVVVHEGAIVYERYSPHPDDGRHELMAGYSVAKSVTSALVGILVGDGQLAVDEPAPVPEWQVSDDPRGEISLSHLMQMSSGLDWEEGRFPGPGDVTTMLARDDAGRYAASKDLVDPPGDVFEYNTGATMLIARILADEMGSGQQFEEFAHERLLGRIGMDPVGMRFDDAGTWLGGVSLEATARAFAKFGLLYLRDGVWEGERILPQGWVEYSRTPSPANPEYGAGWWLDLERDGVLYAVGVRGQAITVDPSHDLVIAQLATDGAVSLPVTEAILDAYSAPDGQGG